MCGFAGFIDPSRQYNNDVASKIATDMANAITHRGPDDAGVWFDAPNHLALAFRRLAIIDISSHGHQPLISSNHQFAMVFNGEIYNYIELKAELAADGYTSSANSDSVVLFEALQYWGVDKTLAKINGMFAIAFWDGHQRQLYLIRDRIGQKPLYYYFDQSKLLFGSELKSFLTYPSFRPELNQQAVAEFLKYAYVPEPLAIYQKTFKVTPGDYVVYSSDSNTISSHTYWSLEDTVQAQHKAMSDSEYTDSIHEALRRSVKLRMRSDVPFGSFLSGGIDSSLITSLMQSQSSTAIKTFSIGFNEAQYDEAHYAKQIALHLGTDHTELYVTAAEAQAVIPQIPTIYDEPFADPSQLPTYLLSKLTRQHVTVALSGDGGDESFAGYNRHFWVPNMWRHLGQRPRFIKKVYERLIHSLSPQKWNQLAGLSYKFIPARFHYQNVGDKLYKLLPFMQSDSPLEVYDKLSSFWQQPEVILENNYNHQQQQQKLALDLVQQMMYCDTKCYLPGDILTKVDRASMAVSLEVRSPFLDHQLIEQAWQIPMHMKLKGSQGKLILKDLLSQYLPRELFERPKMGFGVPTGTWIRGPLRDWAEDLLSTAKLNKHGLLKSKPIRQYWSEHLSGQRNWQYPLWCVLMLQSWCDHYRN